MVDFAEDGGDEVELVGLYLIDHAGRPRRVGVALGNEFSDHLLEQRNYLYLAHSKLRPCSFGPELLLGAAPAEIQGEARIRRGGEAIWRKPRSEEHTSELQSLMRISYAVFCLKKKKAK